MTVVPSSIQSRIMATRVSAVLSGTGTRNVLPDSRSTPPNTHWTLTGCPLWYFHQPNLLSSTSTILLGPPSFSEQPAMNTNVVSLQNMPQSAMVFGLRPYSSLVRKAGSRHMMPYVTSKTSRKVSLLCFNQEPVLMDLEAEHLTPATFLRHRHLNPSGILGSADYVISRSQVLHCTLLRSRPTSLRNCIARPSSQKRYVRKSLFGPSSWRSIRRLYEPLGMNGISCRRFSYSSTFSFSFPTILHCTQLDPSATGHDNYFCAKKCCTWSV